MLGSGVTQVVWYGMIGVRAHAHAQRPTKHMVCYKTVLYVGFITQHSNHAHSAWFRDIHEVGSSSSRAVMRQCYVVSVDSAAHVHVAKVNTLTLGCAHAPSFDLSCGELSNELRRPGHRTAEHSDEQ